MIGHTVYVRYVRWLAFMSTAGMGEESSMSIGTKMKRWVMTEDDHT